MLKKLTTLLTRPFHFLSRTATRPRPNRSVRLQSKVWRKRAVPTVVTVTSAADTHVAGLVDLREAIGLTNASTDPSNTIQFAIPGSGLQTINLLSSLPTITRPVLIDGYTQHGASMNTHTTGDNAVLTVQLNGAAAGTNTDGLDITAANTTVGGTTAAAQPHQRQCWFRGRPVVQHIEQCGGR